MGYEKTPSFYNNEEYFNRFLGRTSYYRGLQDVVNKVVSLTQAKSVLELGSALGTTAMLLAKEYGEVSFVGIDIREDIVSRANIAAKGVNNVSFITGDMCNCVRDDLSFDLVYLLYSFRHIEDPLSTKIQFLKDCYANMKEDSFLLIAETFLPDYLPTCQESPHILKLFEQRAKEGYASTFWESLQSLSKDDLKLSRIVAKSSFEEEIKAGDMVYKREDEYLVDFDWLKGVCETIGFRVVIAEPVNSIMEKAILLQR